MENSEILVVDDQIGLCLGLTKRLSNAGYIVKHCTSGVDALRLLQEDFPRLAILDYKMPGMNGLVLKHKIELMSGTTKVILMGNTLEKAIVEKTADARDDAFILKPFSLASVFKNVREAMRIETTDQPRVFA